MGVETATYISGLNATNPVVGDAKTEGDDHLRLIKSTLLATFPEITGAVNATHTQIGDTAAFLQAGTGAVERSGRDKMRDIVSVKDFGAVGDGVTNDATAIQAAIDHAETTGAGTLLFPPGTYYCNAALTVNTAVAHSFKIEGYGAALTSGAAVTGFLLTLSGGFAPYKPVVAGLTINHRNNADAGGGIRLTQTTHVALKDLAFANHNTKAGYACIEIGPATPGNDDSNSFWTLIDQCDFRPHSGGDGTAPAYCVRLLGAANATSIRNCAFSTGVKAIAIQTDGTGDVLANGVLIDGNSFEGVTTCLSVEAVGTPGYWPVGLRVCFNRCESATTWASFTATGGTPNDHSSSPLFIGNYIVAGSITNWFVNSLGARLSILESAYYGEVTNQTFQFNGGVKYLTPGNFEVSNQSGGSAWNGGHLVLGGTHIWVDSSTRLRIKSTAPTSDTDGTVVGTQT